MKTSRLFRTLVVSILISVGCSGESSTPKGRDGSPDGKGSEGGAGSLDGSKADRGDSRLGQTDAGGNVISGTDGGGNPIMADGSVTPGTTADTGVPSLDTSAGQSSDTPVGPAADGGVDVNNQVPTQDANTAIDAATPKDTRPTDTRSRDARRFTFDGREVGSRDVLGAEARRRRDAARFQDAGDAAEAEDAPFVPPDVPMATDAGMDAGADAEDAI